MWIPAAISVAARLTFIGRKSLWIDEALASGVSSMGLGELVRKIATGTPHPPLAFLIIRLSTLLFGSGEVGLRVLIALVVASASIPVYRLVLRSFGQKPAFWSAMLWAVCPFTVSLGQEAWVYGINASLSLWLLDFADMSWRGSRRALAGFVAIGIAGILTQHIFILSILIAGGFYFAVPPVKRVSWKVPAISTGLLLLAYVPVGLFFLEQFRKRSIRMASAGFASGLGNRLLIRAPSEFFRLLAGGLLPEISRNLLDRPRMLAASVVNVVLITSMLVRTFVSRDTALRLKLWLLVSLLLPFAFFLKDAPTIRQLAAVWMPFILVSGFVFGKHRWSGALVVSLCLVALIPYYSLESFPYHRSDWRAGVETIESLANECDVVLIVGGKSTGLAWDFYASGRLTRLTPGGNEPFLSDLERSRIDMNSVLDSLMGDHERVWVLVDQWGGTTSAALAEGYSLERCIPISPRMEVGLIVRNR